MAYSESNVSASEQSGLTRKAPLFVGRNVLRDYNAIPEWRVSGSWSSGADITSGTTRRLFDGEHHAKSAATASGQTEVSLLLDLADVEFDCAFILGHNFASLGGNLDVDLDISDSASFSGAVTLATWSNPSGTTRLGSTRLNSVGTGKRYTTARYVRLRLAKTSGTLSAAPEFGELWLGRRRQMLWPASLPFDEATTRHQSEDVDDGGAAVRYVRNYGGQVVGMTLSLEPPDATDNSSFDSASELREWWESCEHGAEPSLLCLDPSASNPGASTVVIVPTQQRLDIPYSSRMRSAALSFIESAPFLSRET